MKTKLFYLTMALVLVLGLSVGVAMAVPAPALANSVASSTMHFHGDLTDQGGGVYTGTMPMTAGSYYNTGGPGCVGGQTPDGGPCNGGFDVYAKEGGTAYAASILCPGPGDGSAAPRSSHSHGAESSSRGRRRRNSHSYSSIHNHNS